MIKSVRSVRSTRARGASTALPALAAALSSARAPAAAQTSAAADTAQANQARADIKELPVPPTVPQDGVCTHPTGWVSADWDGLGSLAPTRDAKNVFLGITYAGAPATPTCLGLTSSRSAR
ncbi:hypothetical protein [Streptomyces canus]|uniref:hypothetical protein n=1 Tax=Streptomyces canus TaxID=58343 RepID=UPI002E30BD60|nr:hypothetical protein [Streptomyces canus]